ncbi:hypothetical protein SFV1gp59 [Sulfolobus filamentous virus 1]|uniref:Uncharacterized protein n=2 Tax=Alphalipothrixvirus beppuense TaxID=2734584 RepID=A0A346LU98_SUFV1|nr:hypothetical protein HOT91_gp59 [Sulfolobus filamentous virus 1]AXQ00141.1 hypothetical protein SFV1gp59 [Sulfolobus filamentous virus 1]AZI75761.1 hypothetical protein SBFV1_gp60 [Sulfolobales Beppu filamentous phage 1]
MIIYRGERVMSFYHIKYVDASFDVIVNYQRERKKIVRFNINVVVRVSDVSITYLITCSDTKYEDILNGLRFLASNKKYILTNREEYILMSGLKKVVERVCYKLV